MYLLYGDISATFSPSSTLSIIAEILNSVKSFKYLGSTIRHNNKLDQEIHLRIPKASQSFEGCGKMYEATMTWQPTPSVQFTKPLSSLHCSMEWSHGHSITGVPNLWLMSHLGSFWLIGWLTLIFANFTRFLVQISCIQFMDVQCTLNVCIVYTSSL